MGWCYAFGPQIREGCDHAMVANGDSCACAHCGAQCRGLFSGCTAVWAAGPRRVTLSRPTKGSPKVAPRAMTPPPRTEIASVDGTDDVQALRVDMQLLLWKIDQLQAATEGGDRVAGAAREIVAVADALPQQVYDAVSAALETQRRALLAMFGEMEREIVADVAELQSSLPPAGTRDAVAVSDLDARFRWLAEAISERFVTLGNGLARVERRLSGHGSPDPNAAPALGNGNGHGSPAFYDEARS